MASGGQHPPNAVEIERLKRRIEELEHANSQLVQFVNIFANDLKSPLRHIMGFCRIVQKNYATHLGQRGSAFLDQAVAGARRTRNLVDDLVMIVQVGHEAFERVPVPLADVIDEAMTSIATLLHQTGARVTRGRLPEVNVNPKWLTIIFKNLLDNAVKYRRDARPEIFVEGTRTAEGWEISVRDNGIGIAGDRHQAIFDAFRRFDDGLNSYQGSGLGLFVCKEIVARHGGRIWLESSPGVGSTFYFTIPN